MSHQHFLSSEDNRATCDTESSPQIGFFYVVVQEQDEFELLVADNQFQFRPNPIVVDVFPLRTFTRYISATLEVIGIQSKLQVNIKAIKQTLIRRIIYQAITNACRYCGDRFTVI